MARAITGRGASYDIQPDGERAYGGPIGNIVGFVMDATRGACAGLLTLLGGIHMTGSVNAQQISMPAGLEPFAAMVQQFSMNGFSGPAELIGGIVLFLTARRAIARTLGILAFIGLLFAYSQGYSLVDIASYVWAVLGAAAEAATQAAATQSV